MSLAALILSLLHFYNHDDNSTEQQQNIPTNPLNQPVTNNVIYDAINA
jgi:hypothetical protein